MIIGGLFLLLLLTALLGESGVLHLSGALFSSGPAYDDPRREKLGLLEPLSQFDESPGPLPAKFADFVGAAACSTCHASEYALWKQSTHGRAGGTPTPASVISPFNKKPIRYKDATVQPVITEKGGYKFIVEKKEGTNYELKVDAVVGGGHMYGGGTQSYFSKFPDGTWRFVPFDFNKTDQTWFSQRRDDNTWDPAVSELALPELSEWPPYRSLGTDQTGTNCQNCHGSQILIEYNRETAKYDTRFTELAINCESCHGPGRQHIALAEAKQLPGRRDIGMPALDTYSRDQSLLVCFQCHAVKDDVGQGYLPGAPLEKYYALKLPILARSPYLIDGRVGRFAYQQNHLASDCYLSGSMTCVDCHDPHSQKYRDIYGRPLQGLFDNGQCLDCHPSKARKPEAHSKHKPGSPGNLCTSCHMPYLQHPSLGSKVRFARSDHVIPIPRPRFDAQLGIENACSKCHRDKSVEWLQEKMQVWYGRLKPHNPLVAALTNVRRYRHRREAGRNLLRAEIFNPIAQVTALTYFLRNYLTPDMAFLEPEIIQRLQALAALADLDIKALALASLHLARGSDPDMQTYLLEQLRELGPDEDAVRARWAIAEDFLGSFYSSFGEFEKAVVAYRKALQLSPNDAVTLVNLGIAFANRGEAEQAIAAFKLAADLDPTNSTARTNMGVLYSRQGNTDLAIQAFQEAIAAKSVDQQPYLLLADAYVRTGRTDAAARLLRRALALFKISPKIENFLQKLQAK